MNMAENIFLSVPKKFVLLRRSNFASGTNPLARVASLFCTRLLTDKPNGLVVCGSSNAHKVCTSDLTAPSAVFCLMS